MFVWCVFGGLIEVNAGSFQVVLVEACLESVEFGVGSVHAFLEGSDFTFDDGRYLGDDLVAAFVASGFDHLDENSNARDSARLFATEFDMTAGNKAFYDIFVSPHRAGRYQKSRLPERNNLRQF